MPPSNGGGAGRSRACRQGSGRASLFFFLPLPPSPLPLPLRGEWDDVPMRILGSDKEEVDAPAISTGVPADWILGVMAGEPSPPLPPPFSLSSCARPSNACFHSPKEVARRWHLPSPRKAPVDPSVASIFSPSSLLNRHRPSRYEHRRIQCPGPGDAGGPFLPPLFSFRHWIDNFPYARIEAM